MEFEIRFIAFLTNINEDASQVTTTGVSHSIYSQSKTDSSKFVAMEG